MQASSAVDQLGPLGVRTIPDSAATADRDLLSWDRFVASIPGGDLVQTSAWAHAKEALGFETCNVVTRHRGTIVGGGHMIIRRFGLLGGVGYVSRGPLLGDTESTHVAQVLDDLEAAARARRIRHLIVQPPEHGAAIAAELERRGYQSGAPAVAPTATMRIDLTQSADQILAAMNPGKRSELRRAQRNGVVTRLAGSEELELFHSLYEATAQRQGFTPVSRSYLRNHWDALASLDAVKLLFAAHDGRTLASLWLTAFGDTVTERLSGWNGEGRKVQPNVACCWAAIQWAKEQGYRHYDLGGIDRDAATLILAGQKLPDRFQKTPGAFKREFGAAPVLLPPATQFTFNPMARWLVRTLYPRLRGRKHLGGLINRLRNG